MRTQEIYETLKELVLAEKVPLTKEDKHNNSSDGKFKDDDKKKS